MSIDDKLESADHIRDTTKKVSTVAKCFHNGQYHYRSTEKDGKQYCCLSDETCMYYKQHKQNGLCTAYNTKRK